VHGLLEMLAQVVKENIGKLPNRREFVPEVKIFQEELTQIIQKGA
jgi:hypothetical protein